MNITLVTTLPPGQGTLNEYGWHFAKSLLDNPKVERLHLLVDELPPGAVYPDLGPRVRIQTCWRFNDPTNSLRLAKTISKLKTDAVILNLQFASFGDKSLAAGLGLCLPMLLRAMKIPTITLLHNLMETVDLKSAGYATNWLQEKVIRLGGRLATRMLLCSDRLALTIPKYLRVIENQYGAKNVFHAPHGTFQQDLNDFLPLPPRKDIFRIMAFGKFGTYKKVEPLIEAYKMLLDDPNRAIELSIAGSDSPKAKGYLKSVAAKYADVPGLSFTGYVAEEDVPRLFKQSSVVVFPYTSTTGSSGVLHQAGSFARAAVMPAIGDFMEVIESEGYVGEYFQPGCADSLASALSRLRNDYQRLQNLGDQNYKASVGIPMNTVTDLYIQHIENLTKLGEPSCKTSNKTPSNANQDSTSGLSNDWKKTLPGTSKAEPICV